ncbi:hypothetical protein AZZ61_003737, partial [Klebsiella variicola]
PVRRSSPESKLSVLPLDLHVLGLPPAFNLSHDQTLQFKFDARELNFVMNYVCSLRDLVFIFRPRTLRIHVTLSAHTDCLINC